MMSEFTRNVIHGLFVVKSAILITMAFVLVVIFISDGITLGKMVIGTILDTGKQVIEIKEMLKEK